MNGSVLKANSLLRWAGGKAWMIQQIKSIIPLTYNNYHEPFVGGGSVFFNIDQKGISYISDSNKELICFYKQVQTNLNNLLDMLYNYKNNEKAYYKIRDLTPKTDLEIAARFYYLNRTCFNGLYRVNQGGKFNVPYGFRDVPIIDLERFKFFHTKLQRVKLKCADFEQALNKVKEGDLVFLDPPYTVAHNKNGFIEYNQKIFSWEDQERLFKSIKKLIESNVYFILTNAFHDSIKNLYNKVGKHYEIERFSTISGMKTSRQKISELIITNCI